MSIDYSEVCIGPPAEVMGRLGPRLGQLALASLNLRTGLTTDPHQTWRRHLERHPWSVLKLLWITHSFAQACEMAELLLSYDGKLFERRDLLTCELSGDDRRASKFYAYALIR